MKKRVSSREGLHHHASAPPAARFQDEWYRAGPRRRSPDGSVKQLLRTIEALQQEQEGCEAARLAADDDARAAAADIAALEQALHAGGPAVVVGVAEGV